VALDSGKVDRMTEVTGSSKITVLTVFPLVPALGRSP
jgi:hypothetical protein